MAAPQSGSAFVDLMGVELDKILCEPFERTVGADNCVAFEGRSLQIPASGQRLNYHRVKVRGHRYCDGALALFHGPRKLAHYPSCAERAPIHTQAVA